MYKLHALSYISPHIRAIIHTCPRLIADFVFSSLSVPSFLSTVAKLELDIAGEIEVTAAVRIARKLHESNLTFDRGIRGTLHTDHST